MAITFLIGMITGDRGSFETNHPPTPVSFPREIGMTEMSEHVFHSYLYSLSGKTYKNNMNTFYFVVG